MTSREGGHDRRLLTALPGKPSGGVHRAAEEEEHYVTAEGGQNVRERLATDGKVCKSFSGVCSEMTQERPQIRSGFDSRKKN